MRLIPIFAAKFIFQISKILRRPGSTWSGHVALKINKNIAQNILKHNPNLKLVFVAGTNGKTTTAKLIQEVLESQGLKVFRNAAGANLLNGITSSLIKHSDLSGKINYDIAVFEIDENTLPLILSELSNINCHLSLIFLNLFRDQLDRYGEVNTIAKNWLESLKSFNNQNLTLIVNGDDPMLRFIGEKSDIKTYYFGLPSKLMGKKEISSDVDFLYCPNCDTKLMYSKRSYSHLGVYKCPKCKLKNTKTENFPSLPNPMLGIYNKYNINAAATLLIKVFNLKEKQIKKNIEAFSPAFGRQEKIEYENKEIFLLLSKNPTGFNQSIEGVLEHDKNPNVVLLLNDRIPDGRDVSWIWDVDFEDLKSADHITISGDRAYDMGLRIKYAGIPDLKYEIRDTLKSAVKQATKKASNKKSIYILATYSAMLDVRKILKGRSIL